MEASGCRSARLLGPLCAAPSRRRGERPGHPLYTGKGFALDLGRTGRAAPRAARAGDRSRGARHSWISHGHHPPAGRRRALQPRTRSSGRSPLFRPPARSITHAGQSAPQSRSSLNYSQSGDRTGFKGGGREVSSPPPPPGRQTHQRAQRSGLRDTFQVPTPRSEPPGPVSQPARPEAGRKEESDLKSHSSFVSPPPTSAFPKT